MLRRAARLTVIVRIQVRVMLMTPAGATRMPRRYTRVGRRGSTEKRPIGRLQDGGPSTLSDSRAREAQGSETKATQRSLGAARLDNVVWRVGGVFGVRRPVVIFAAINQDFVWCRHGLHFVLVVKKCGPLADPVCFHLSTAVHPPADGASLAQAHS